jgi:hypothetical protein
MFQIFNYTFFLSKNTNVISSEVRPKVELRSQETKHLLLEKWVGKEKMEPGTNFVPLFLLQILEKFHYLRKISGFCYF